MPAQALARVVQGLPASDDPDLLVGAEHFADAAVYRLADDLAIVQSVDFFPPIVDDPFTFGRIAAANALGDLYAAGARPRTALNVVGFPDRELELEVLGEILRGGAERVRAAGAVVAGGHTVRDAEVKYGLAVTGTVDPARMMTNAAARPGDVLVLTKALGTGFVTTAARADACADDVLDAACASMVALNAAAAASAVEHGARAATDVTGFGLAGHAREMAEASGVTLVINLERLPVLPGALDLADGRFDTSAQATNRAYVEAGLAHVGRDDAARRAVLFDPQTSGGLLVAVPPDAADAIVADCVAAGLDAATVVGRVEARQEVVLVTHG